MALLVDPDLALGVLQTLARFQGRDVDPGHRGGAGPDPPRDALRRAPPSLALGGGSVYYGTVDATPLFVMLLGELRRWGLAREVVERLLPHADRALDVDRATSATATATGTSSTSAHDRPRPGATRAGRTRGTAIRFADGRLAQPPIALCEVQGYVYAAYLARAHFAAGGRRRPTARQRWPRQAPRSCRTAFNRDFWLPGPRLVRVGLDGDKRPIDALASNMGHCLWTGIVDEDKARAGGRAAAVRPRCSAAGGSARSPRR